ncbi:Serine/threonine-protein kinase TOR [Phytophthora cactorum]|nr:Serine/threonine-protein kinase TOR [Phytophthora cactorum]
MEQAMRVEVPLEEQPKAWTRVPCTACQRSYKFYCPKCNIPLDSRERDGPALKLPLQVHVWFQDKIKKSTAPHAKNAVVVYPSFEAETLEQISAEELRDIRTLIFIDCPWQKAPVIMTDPAIANLRHVKLAQPPKESNFWRYHKAERAASPQLKVRECVATIQLMLEEYTAAAKKAEIALAEGSQDTQLPDLLFFFNLQFSRIVEHFEDEADPERKPPMNADEKERRRLMYTGEQPPVTMQSKRHRRCYNCKKDDHHSKDCPQPCRYCKQLGHFSANCSMKQAAYERRGGHGRKLHAVPAGAAQQQQQRAAPRGAKLAAVHRVRVARSVPWTLHEMGHGYQRASHAAVQLERERGRMGGIAAMDELVELFIAERNDQTIIEFAHSLTKVFEKIPSADPPMLRVAAKALGHIVSTGGTSLIEFVEDYHVKPALEWLKNETFHVRRHAAVMILKELSINAPSTSFRYMDKYFDFIWSAFWDSKLVVRVSASESLQSCFMLIQQRESNRKTSWYNRALDEAEGAFKRNSSDATHGALLILNELLRNTGDFMHSHYGRACRLVFSHQDHKSATVRSAVISLFPRLAKFNTSVFVEKCYRPCMNHLLEVLFSATTTTRPDALLSIGKLSLAIGPLLARDEQALMAIMNGIKGGLQVRKKDFDTHREALACLRMLAETVGPALIRVDLESMVGPLFQNDLDSSLVETLTTIVKKIPPMKPIIQQKLFERLSSILRSRHNDVTGSATTPTTTGAKTNGASENGAPSAEVSSAIAMQALALETLANFDFQGNRLIPIMSFVHETVVKFLDHEVATIRKSAALTCCKLLLPSGEDRGGNTAMTSEDFARPVTSVLERLLTVGIADNEASIRLRVLASLDSRFDPLLALNDNLRCLFIALNDEVFSIRQTAMSTLGRLTHHNPSTVLPSLRQTLVQLLAELEFSGDSRGKEEGALLIGCLLRSASQLAQPYVLPILRVLMKNLREDSERRSHSRSTVSVSKAILATLGDLAEVGAQELTPYLGQLLPDVIDEMRDSSNPQILQVAIKTLGQLVSSTGYVVLPYHEYPELLDLLCQALQKSGDAFESLRIEAGRTLGVLGALDPYNLRLFHLQKQGKLTDAKKKEFRSSAFVVGAGGVFSLMASAANPSQALALGNATNSANGAVIGIRIGNGIGGPGVLDGSSEEDAQQLGESLLLTPARKVAKSDKQTSGKLTNIILEVPPDDLLPSMIPDSSQYFPTVAINALIRILLEPRNSVHYQGTFMAIMYICKSQRKRMGQHLDKIIPAFLYALEKVNRSLRKFLFEQLCDLVQIVEEQIQPHLDHVALLSIVNSYWDEHLEEVLNLVKKLANSLGEKFRVYLPDLIPQMLRVIRTERDNPARPRTLLVLKTAVSLGRLLDGYLHLIIPALVALIQSDADVNARKQGLGSLGSLVKKLNVSVYASKIIHMLARVISSQPEMVYLAMDCLCCMVYTMGDDYAIFVPVISQVLGRHTSRSNDIFDRYDLLVSKILKYQPLPVASWATDPLKARTDTANDHKDSNSAAQDETKSLPCDQKNLVKAWEASQRSTKEDWNEWILAFSVELLRESPSPVLRACKELASVYQPLARELFNASFVSVWPHLSSTTQDNLIRSLESAFQSPHLPSEILQTLLNLAEFMEHDDQPLPIDIRLLGSLADKCHSFAKALHYKELEFNTNPSTDGIQALISINSKLNQPEAARGILKYALEKLPGIEVKASWHEKLLRWDDALATHDRVLLENPNNVEAIFGKMRCLWAIGEWRKLNDHVQETWSKIYGEGQDLNGEQEDGEKLLDVPPALKRELCSSGARVAFSLQNWDSIPKYINSDMDATESHLFKAVVSIRRMELDEAMNSIGDCRKEMDPTLRSLVSESYARAYIPAIVNLQMLTELEEIVSYLKTFAYKNNGELTLLSTPASSTSMSTTASRRKQSISSLNFVSSSSSTSYGHEKQVALKKLQTIWTRRMLGVERNIQVWQSLMLVRSLVFDPREDVDIWLKYARLCLKSGHINLAASALWRVGAQPFIRSVERDPYAPIPINLGGNAGASQGFANGLLSLADSAAQDPRVAFSYLRHLWAENREDVALKQMDYFIEALEQHGDPTNEDLRKLRVQVYIQLGEWQMSLTEPHKQSYDHVLGCLETATKLDPTNDRAWHEWALMNFRALEATVKESGQGDPKRYAVRAIQGFFRSISFGHTSYDVTKDVLRLLTLWFTQGNRSDVHMAMVEGFQEASIDTWLDVIPQLIARIDTPNQKTSELLHDLLSRIGQAHPQALIYPITVASKALNPTRKHAAEGILAAVRRHSSQLVYEADMVSRELIRVAILWNELWHGALEEASKHFFNNRDVTAMIAELAPLHEQMDRIGTEESPTLREVAFYQAFARDLAFAKEWTNVYERTKSLDDLNQAWDIYYSVFSKIRKQLANLSTLELANVGPKLLSVHNLTLAVPGTYKAGAPIVRIQSFDTKVTVLTSKQRPRKVSINGSDGKAYPFLLKGHEDLRQDERVMQLFGVINTLLANDSDTSKRNLAIQRYSVLPLSHTSGLIGWVPNCDTLHQLIRDYREARKIQLNVSTALWCRWHPTTTSCRSCRRLRPSTMERDKYPEKIPFRLTRMLTQAMEVSGIEGNFRYTCEASMRVLRDNRDSLMAVLEAFVYDPLINWRLLKKDAVPSHAQPEEDDGAGRGDGPDANVDRSSVRVGNEDGSEVDADNDGTSGGNPDDDKLAEGSMKSSTSSAPVTPRRRRHSSSEAAMLGYNMDMLDPAMARNSMSETQRDNFGTSFVAAEHPQLNEKALSVIERVKKKLAGRDLTTAAGCSLWTHKARSARPLRAAPAAARTNRARRRERTWLQQQEERRQEATAIDAHADRDEDEDVEIDEEDVAFYEATQSSRPFGQNGHQGFQQVTVPQERQEGGTKTCKKQEDEKDEMPLEKLEARPRKAAWATDKQEVLKDKLPVKFMDGSKRRRRAEENDEEMDSDVSDMEFEEITDADASAPTETPKPELSPVDLKRQREIRLITKKVEIAQLCESILENPEDSFKKSKEHPQQLSKIQQLQELCRDPDAIVQRLSLMSQLSVFLDILPDYRIRLHKNDLSAEEKGKQNHGRPMKKKVQQMQDYEATLLNNYQKFLKYCAELTGVRCLAQLLEKKYAFNFHLNLVIALVPMADSQFPSVREQACASFESVFKSDKTCACSYEIVQQISSYVKQKQHRVQPFIIRTLLVMPLVVTMEQGEALEKAKSDRKKRRRQQAEGDSIAAGLKEAEAVVDRAEREKTQADILHELVLIYFRILKQATYSQALPPCWKGPGGQELMIDDKEFVDILYRLLHRFAEGEAGSDSSCFLTLLQCVEAVFLRRKEIVVERVASFVKRLLLVAQHLPPHQALAILSLLRALFHRYSKLQQLLESDVDRVASGEYRADIDDPDFANPFSNGSDPAERTRSSAHGRLRSVRWFDLHVQAEGSSAA